MAVGLFPNLFMKHRVVIVHSYRQCHKKNQDDGWRITGIVYIWTRGARGLPYYFLMVLVVFVFMSGSFIWSMGPE